MEDNLNMTCSDIRKKLKAFLDDLLAEDEYQAFVAHVDHCKECNDYVRKIGSISNQLWELGDIKAPSDLASTILFRLKQAEQEIRKPKFVISKKLGIGILVVALTVPLIFLGVYHLKSRKRPQDVGETPTIEVHVGRKPAISRREAESLLGELKGIAARLGVSKKEKAVESDTGREEEAIEEDAGRTTPVRKEALLLVPKPLHWHFLYAKERNLKREEAQRKAGLTNAVNSPGIITDYQTESLLVFTAKGEKIENVLEKIILMSSGSSFLRDYTPMVSVDPNQEHRVSVYFEKETASVRHWHATCVPSQEQRLLDVIREESGRINYESEELIVFSISKDAIKKLKARILAMRIDFSEFDYAESKEGRLQSGPVEISVYISNR